MEIKAYAKINIGLAVGKRGEDGLHSLESYMALIDLYDTLCIEIEDADELSVSIERSKPYLEDGAKDIMEKCAQVFSRRFSRTFRLSVRIEKRIPSKAGLGGGSADAAAILRELFRFYSIEEDIAQTAILVGSDVPFLASGYSTAFVSGRGEKVEKRDPLGPLPLLLFVPERGSDTAKAYKALDTIERTIHRLPPLSFPDKPSFPNDFELVFPLSIPQELSESNAYVSLSGSGSAWYALFPDSDVPDVPGSLHSHLIC